MAIPGLPRRKNKIDPESEEYYTFTPNSLNTCVLVEGSDGQSQSYSIEALRRLARSNMEEYRVMSLGALKAAGLSVEDEPEKEILSDTIVTIDGVKVRQNLLTRSFIAKLSGIVFRGKSLSKLAKTIKERS